MNNKNKKTKETSLNLKLKSLETTNIIIKLLSG